MPKTVSPQAQARKEALAAVVRVNDRLRYVASQLRRQGFKFQDGGAEGYLQRFNDRMSGQRSPRPRELTSDEWTEIEELIHSVRRQLAGIETLAHEEAVR